eukprot:754200-Hanusia_phi.AAC.1
MVSTRPCQVPTAVRVESSRRAWPPGPGRPGPGPVLGPATQGPGSAIGSRRSPPMIPTGPSDRCGGKPKWLA